MRRQWERIVWLGGPHDEGAREVYCYFQIERVEGKERLRHIEHEIHSVLKAVFTAVEDFKDMLAAARDLAPRLRSRRGRARRTSVSARSFLDWLLRTTTSSRAPCATAWARTASRTACRRARRACSRTPRCCPSSSRG